MIVNRRVVAGTTRLLACAFLFVFGASCASSQHETTAESTWKRLLERRSTFEGARSYVKMRVRSDRGRWRFNARILVDSEGRMFMSALSPMGTSAFTLNFEHDRVVLQDHGERTVWEGSPEDLPGILGIEGSFSTRLLPYLLLALPPEPAEGRILDRMGDYIRIETGHAMMVVGKSGPIETQVVEKGLRIKASYSIPSVPPTSVTIETDAGNDQRVEVDHLDLTFGRTVVPPIEIDPSYERIVDVP